MGTLYQVGSGLSNIVSTTTNRDGTIWLFGREAVNGYEFVSRYSKDGGVTWTVGPAINPDGNTSTALSTDAPGSFHIDEDDYLNIIFIRGQNVYYVRYSPNTERTTWTRIGTAYAVPNLVSTQGGVGIVTHRNPEGAGWFTHISFSTSSPASLAEGAYYTVLFIAADGTVSVHRAAVRWHGDSNNWLVATLVMRHNGDGAIYDTQPDIYILAVNYLEHVRFIKAIWSAGNVWTLSSVITLTTIDGGHVSYAGNGLSYCKATNRVTYFTTSRDSVGTEFAYCREIDVNTNTVYDLNPNDPGTAFNPYAPNFITDIKGDIWCYVFADPQDLIKQNKYTRSSASWSGWTNIATETVGINHTNGNRHRIRSWQLPGGRIIWPYAVNIGSGTYAARVWVEVLNQPPNTPTSLQRTGVQTDNTPNFSAVVSDPDGDTNRVDFEIETIGGTVIATVTSAYTASSGTATAEYTSALGTGQYRVRARAYDGTVFSGYTSYVNFDVTASTSKDLTSLWDTRQNIQKDIAAVWAAQAQNLREAEFYWNILNPVPPVDKSFKWSIKPAWERVDDDYVKPVWTKASS